MIKRALAALCILTATLTPAFAQSTKSSLSTQISSDLPTQYTGQVTPAIMSVLLNSMTNSFQQYTGVNPQIGTSYTFQASDYGQFVTFTNSGSVAVTLPQATGSMATWNAIAINLGTGTVTITPTVSTINGSSSFSLGQNQSVWIAADPSGNYQIFRGFGSGTVTGPGSTTVGDIATWGNTSGTILADTAALGLAHGGTNCPSCAASNGGIIWSNATEFQVLSGTSTANQILLSGATATPAWSSMTYPADVTTAGQIIESSAAHTLVMSANVTFGVGGSLAGEVALAAPIASGAAATIQNPSATSPYNFNLPISAGNANQILTSGGGAQTAQSYQNIASLLTQGTGITLSGTTNVTISLSTPVSVSNGGTGAATLGAHGSLVGEGTGAIVSVTTASTGLCFLSNGAAADPSWGSCSGGSSITPGYGITTSGSTVTAPWTAPFLGIASDT